MRVVILLLAIFLASCASSQSDRRSDEELASKEFSLNCAHGLYHCYSEARRICGGPFEEIDHGAGVPVIITDGAPRMENVQQSLTVRCD
jgi:hypothetical protein